MNSGRRTFLTGAAALGIAGAVQQQLAAEDKPAAKGQTAEEVSPGEDLMREHGILKRVLMIYGECVRRVDAHEDVPIKPLAAAADIIRTFVEDYHEKLEEDFLFPRFRKAGKHVGLVKTLLEQHVAGRKLTDVVLQILTPAALQSEAEKLRLKKHLNLFIRMYNAHEAREDTVLFPAFHEIVTQAEYDALGDQFEKKENDLFGGDGFEKNVARVEMIEKALGIYDLDQFTPKL